MPILSSDRPPDRDASGVAERERVDWARVARELDADGHAALGPLLSLAAAERLAARYDDTDGYRSHVQMKRHGFGQGEYKYYAYPLPPEIAALRGALYPPLARIANGWERRLGSERRYPNTHAALLEQCRAGGQTRPTPLILRYGRGDYNCLHQDVYGAHTFPLQVVILLSDPADFTGGELVLTEQRPRMQSRVEVAPMRKGHGVVFAVNERPKDGARGAYRVRQRHGVSQVRGGQRHTLGVIFHDAT